jgi:transposase
MVVGMELYSEIRQAYLSGESQRSIAQRLGISRQSVKKYCEGKTMPGVRKEYSRTPTVITDDVETFIRACIQEDAAEGLKKQTHTAKRIYDRLVADEHFTGSYSIVRRIVHELRADYVPAQADMPLEYDPGDAIQIDWGEATVYLDSVRTTVQIFCGRLCYSCDIFVMACKSQNQESFLEAQQRMFEHFGGVPNRLIFDNAKVAVKEGFGLHAKPQDAYRRFAAHYAFKTDFCNIASGNEKGLVEGLVNYARKNFFVPVPRAASMEELNEQLRVSCLNYRQHHKVDGRVNTVAESYAVEKAFLHPIAPYKYETARIATPSVGDYSTVRFDRNSYSVPVRFLRKTVTVKGYANSVHIVCDRDTIVTYERLFGQGQTAYKLEHYLDLLERKPRSVFQAKPVRQNVKQELLDWGKTLPGGNREMVRLLRLCTDYGEDRVLAARQSFPAGVIPNVDMIRSCLEAPRPGKVISINDEISITQSNLAYYDEQCGVAAR